MLIFWREISAVVEISGLLEIAQSVYLQSLFIHSNPINIDRSIAKLTKSAHFEAMNDQIETRTESDLSFAWKPAIEPLNVIVACVMVSESVRLSTSFTSLSQRIQIDKKLKVI